MAKKLTKVELNFNCQPDGQGIWQATASADISIIPEEYTDFQPMRKGIVITLTPTQETTILNFIRNVVVPQAEGAK